MPARLPMNLRTAAIVLCLIVTGGCAHAVEAPSTARDAAVPTASTGAAPAPTIDTTSTPSTTASAITSSSTAAAGTVAGTPVVADPHSWLFRDGEAVVWSDGSHLFERSFSNCGSTDQLNMVLPPLGAKVHSLDELKDAPTEESTDHCSGDVVRVPLAGWSLLAPWSARPRPVKIGPTDSAVYIAEAKRVLAELGSDPVDIGTIADLNGDGTMEVVIARGYWEASDVSVWSVAAGVTPRHIGLVA
jgi:hypothetical protein